VGKIERASRFRALLLERDGVAADDVIMSREQARERGLTGTLVFPTGNLAPEGSVIKATAIDPSVVDRTGFTVIPARRGFLLQKPTRSRHCGRAESRPGTSWSWPESGRSAQGMEETYQVTSALKAQPFGKHVALLTDARFSGVSTGACVGHIGPEALAGGPLGKIRENDIISLIINMISMDGSINFTGMDGRSFSPDEGAGILASRPRHPGIGPHPSLPDDTRVWAALQQASGGTWAGCVYDAEKIVTALAKGLGAS
jgi:dihydroxyacid dehydratase/phosphogluconate dehydratase